MTLSRGYLGIANASADKCKETNECSNLNKHYYKNLDRD